MSVQDSGETAVEMVSVPRTSTHGYSVNTTDDEKADLVTIDFRAGGESVVSSGDEAVAGGAPVGPKAAASTTMIRGIAFEWSDITMSVQGPDGEPKEILHGCNGRAEGGVLYCIMGPSGAGKTSLLNILAGRVSRGWTGVVTADSVRVHPVEFRRNIAYVMQEEALFATQTPREALHFSASMRLPVTTDAVARTQLVEGIIAQLELGECADTLIGSALIRGISGGERKRTAIAVELITSPKALFLDEPTSGLDSYSAYKVVRTLRRLARRGCTVISTIHQPSSEVFHSFDGAVLLESGHVIYNDRVSKLAQYYAEMGGRFVCPDAYNIADHVMFLMQRKETKADRDALETIRRRWTGVESKRHVSDSAKDDKSADVLTDSNAVKAAEKGSYAAGAQMQERLGFWAQLWLLFLREFNNAIRDKHTLAARFGLTVVLNLLGGFVFFGVGEDDVSQSRYGAILHLGIGSMFAQAQPMLLTFPSERPVFLREYYTGTYDVLPYFISKFFIEAPLAVLTTLLALGIAYPLMELQGSFAQLWGGMVLIAVASSSIGVFLGCVTTNVKSAIELAPAMFVPQILFSGFFVQIRQIPVFLRWAQWICPLKYTINIMLLTEFDQDTPVNNAILDSAEIQRSDLWLYVGLSLSVLVAYRLMGAIALRKLAETMHQ